MLTFISILIQLYHNNKNNNMILRKTLEELRLQQSIKHNTEFEPIVYIQNDGTLSTNTTKIEIKSTQPQRINQTI